MTLSVTLLSLVILLQLHPFSQLTAAVQGVQFQKVHVDGRVPVGEINNYSPSFAVGMNLFKYDWVKYMTNPKLITLVQALGPSYVRMGGTESDFSHFVPPSSISKYTYRVPLSSDCVRDMPKASELKQFVVNAEKEMLKDIILKNTNVSYTAAQFDEIMRFIHCAKWKFVFGLNLLDRKGQMWDPMNAMDLLNYAKRKGYHLDWELGNEPNAYRHKVGYSLSPVEVAKGFLRLKSILESDPYWKRSAVIGPDVSALSKKSSKKYLRKFLEHAMKALSEITYHHYYINSVNSTVENFTDYNILNTLKSQVDNVNKLIKDLNPPSNIGVWLGETSSAYGGGADGLSNAYVAGFMWLDKLGICASNGVEMVFRQTLLEGHYAIIDKYFDPYPDYWLTLLYKTLVGRKVLKAYVISDDDQRSENAGKFRVYAHCTREEKSAVNSTRAITLYYLNLFHGNKRLIFSDPIGYDKPKVAMTYILTSEPGNITSRDVYLNGKVLEMIDIYTMPPLVPEKVDLQDGNGVVLPGMSFGFIVLPDVNAEACINEDV